MMRNGRSVTAKTWNARNGPRAANTVLWTAQPAARRAMKGKKLCRMHERMEEAKALKLDLGPMEDPDSIQVAIKKLQAAVIDGQLDHRQVASLSYLIQLAAWNVTRTSMAMREQ